MDITPYVDSLRRDLIAAAEAAGPETRAAAERLAFALDPAARLALMEAISQAAAEITAELPAGGSTSGSPGATSTSSSRPRRPQRPSPRAAGAAEPRRTTRTAPSPGSRCGCPSRSRPAPRSSRPPPATRSTPGWSTWSAPPPASAPINVDIDLSSIPFFGGNDPFSAKGRGNRRMTGWL